MSAPTTTRMPIESSDDGLTLLLDLFALEDGFRLRTLADVVAHLGASGRVGLLDATEVRVRRPAAHKAGRHRFVSGKARGQHLKALGSPMRRAAAVLRADPPGRRP